MRLLTAIGAGVLLTLATATGSRSAGTLNILCGVDEAWCAVMEKTYEAKTGLHVTMARMSTGEILDRVRAEKDAPTVDVWWGGTGVTHLQAAYEGLLERHRPRQEADLLPWARNFYSLSGGTSVGLYAGALGFAYNADLLSAEGLPAPNCWKDLAKPIYRGHILSGNPHSSGTAFTTLVTLVQLLGEDEAFAYMRELGRNIAEYTKAGSEPVKAAGRGKIAIGIAFMHDAVTQKEAGAPLVIVAPCEGTGYEIGAVSIVKGSRNLEEARRFVDFALSPEGQATGAAAGQNQVPSNARAKLPPAAPDISMIKMVDYDFATFGSPEQRDRLLGRFDREINPTN
ncbi:iron(III) transport system substrate-binding protein [Neorhizobium galegae]|uniref:ABC transporter substrate-binding protein n=1 Tax=Neorhizobium galegae TaxID=399 RepID=UPI003D7C15A1|nr:iron(III) transport system substrate-binding protein [Neorhizobium galegae]